MSRTRTSSRLRRAGRGSVAVIAFLLVSSAVLRVASGVALAEDKSPNALPLPAAVATTQADGTAQSTGAETSRRSRLSDEASRNEMDSLLQALQAREAEVTERERQMALRSKALEVANEEITRRLAILEEAEAELRKTLALADGAAEDDITRLTTVYENMKPKDAAKLFEAMEPDFAAGFLGRMRPDAAASILAGLTPEAAYSISVILAGRNARVPKT